MTKIDIFSGFLGAGKTTFIQKLIKEAYKNEQLVLIENEFGEIGIDGGFLKEAGIEITEMNSGCICCSLVGDFATNLNEVITKYHPDRILIEPSGVGKLSDVMKSVIDIEKEQDVKLNALVTVVNAIKAKKQMKAFGEFFNNQIEHATTIVLSRSQNANAEQLEECVKMMQELNHDAAIITTAWDAIDGKQILNVMEGQDNLEMKVLAEHHAHHHHHDHDEECCCGHHHEHEHHHDEDCSCGHHHEHEHHHADEVFQTVGIESAKTYDLELLEKVLYKLAYTEEYGVIVRAKGIIKTNDGWKQFNLSPEEYEVVNGNPIAIGKICVIGSNLAEHNIKELF